MPFHLLQSVDLARPYLFATAEMQEEGEDFNAVIAASIALVFVEISGVVSLVFVLRDASHVVGLCTRLGKSYKQHVMAVRVVCLCAWWERLLASRSVTDPRLSHLG